MGFGIYSLNQTHYIIWMRDTSKGALKVYANLNKLILPSTLNEWRVLYEIKELHIYSAKPFACCYRRSIVPLMLIIFWYYRLTRKAYRCTYTVV